MLSDIPFEGPIAATRVTRIDGEFITNPTKELIEKGDMDIVVAGSKEALVMVEGSAREATEADVIDALMFAHESINELITFQEEMVEGLSIEKRELAEPEENEEIKNAVIEFSEPKLRQSIVTESKSGRRERRPHFLAIYKDDFQKLV